MKNFNIFKTNDYKILKKFLKYTTDIDVIDYKIYKGFFIDTYILIYKKNKNNYKKYSKK